MQTRKIAALGILFASLGTPDLQTVYAVKAGYNQADCPTIVQKAIDMVSAECSSVGRNRLCYGNNTLHVQFRAGAPVVSFQNPGDQLDVTQISQLTLSSLDTASGSWGVAEMKIKADLPAANPTQNVTMILFGDVQLTDGTANANTAATVTAKTPVAVPGSTMSGPYQGLQAFYFQSNDVPGCDQAPHDGILIQSPVGKQRVTLVIDDAKVSLGSTVFIRARAGQFLTINTLEGSAQVTAAGVTETADPGSMVQVPLDSNLHASGPPSTPDFYSADTVRALPITALPVSISAAPGLPPNPVVTHWTWQSTGGKGTCITIAAGTGSSTLMSAGSGDYLWYTASWQLGQVARHDNFLLTRSSDGSYHGAYNTTNVSLATGQVNGLQSNHFVYRFTDPSHITGQKTFNVTLFSGRSCTVTVTLTFAEVDSIPLLPTASPTP